MANGARINELLEQYRARGMLNTYTEEEHATERVEIAAAFEALGMTWAEGVAKICAHDYRHDEPFDTLAERWMSWDRWDRVMRESTEPTPGAPARK